MPVGEPFVINAKQVQDGRLKIMNSDEILGDIETNLIACAVNHAAFNPGTCKPTAKRPVGPLVIPFAPAGYLVVIFV